MSGAAPWSAPLRLNELAHGAVSRRIAADDSVRPAIAEALGLDRLDGLEADLAVSPWQDGALVEGRWSADIEQTCGVTLEPFASHLEGRFSVRLLPPEHAGAAPREVVIDPEDEDPPDLIEDGRIDLAALVVEHLALDIDPFPRKPGAVFVAPQADEPPSPFAVLRDLKAKRGED